jgi:hypothetical protein
MLRVIMSVSAEGAGNYFDVALKKSDYYNGMGCRVHITS